MKKNVLIKGILVLIVIALLAIGFTGCGTVIPTTGTVYISIANDNYWYDIYIDGVWWGETNWSGNITLYNVPLGYHYFQAYDTSGWYYDSLYQTIYAGTNYVTFWVW